MKTSKVNFYDPLYDFVTFEEAAAHARPHAFFDVGWAHKNVSRYGESISPQNPAKDLLPFLSSVEFIRQSFLRQSNLAFLVFPSATHTRLAHSIGSCYLGFVASQRIAVGEINNKNETSTPMYLSEYLERNKLREEFYLALLLHDVGHFPFSHALESNRDFWEVFGTENEFSHEDAACQLVQGQGPIFEASKRRSRIRERLSQTYSHLAELFANKPGIDKDIVCYLISGDRDKYLAAKTDRKQVKCLVLHELVSGLLDLDRVDHYRRDNYFTGLRTGTGLNFPSLLSGICIYYNPAAPNHKKNLRKKTKPEDDLEFRLSSTAIGPAISLLQTKERLSEDCFEHPDGIAYEVMLHQAFNMFLFGDQFYESENVDLVDEELICDLLFSTDEQLLFRMGQANIEKVDEIIFRILNKLPYQSVAKLSFRPDHPWSIKEIRNEIVSLSGVSKTDIVLRASKKFGERDLSKRPQEWLALDRLRNESGKHLSNGKFKAQIRHFQAAQDKPDYLWLYCPDSDTAEKVVNVLSGVTERLNCETEDI